MLLSLVLPRQGREREKRPMAMTTMETGPFGTQGQQPNESLYAKREGEVAKNIEQQTSKLPSDTFLWAAVGAIGAALFMKSARKDHASLFLGQWVAPLLLFGVYNKIVKVAGSDRLSG
jgi:hypothetical protein